MAENAVDPWFNRGVGISKGTLYFEGDRGECLAASLPDGLQGRIANFSFEPGAFAGKYGSRTYHFAAAGLELKLNDGTTRTLTAAGSFSMVAPAYAAKYGVPMADLKRTLARIASKNHFNGARNPRAQFRREMSVDQICASIRNGVGSTAQPCRRPRLSP